MCFCQMLLKLRSNDTVCIRSVLSGAEIRTVLSWYTVSYFCVHDYWIIRPICGRKRTVNDAVLIDLGDAASINKHNQVGFSLQLG